jgi:ferrous iron transport protein B
MAQPSVLENPTLSSSSVPVDIGIEELITFDTETKHQENSEKAVLLLGNLNVGKTTLFNRVCRKNLKVANYPGTSISVGRGTISEACGRCHLIDTPGINSVMPESEDEKISFNILLDEKPDIIALVADGKNLRKSLLLAVQVAEYGIPITIDINMMDEVRQRGIYIDAGKLSSLLGIPVTETVATEGEGVGSFRKALTKARSPGVSVSYPEKIESGISFVCKLLKDSKLPKRAVAVALLAGDEELKPYVTTKCGKDTVEQVESVVSNVQSSFDRPLSAIIQEARLRAVDQMLSEIQAISPPVRMPFSEKIGRWSRQPLTGIPIAALVVALMYLFVGKLGAEILVGLFEGGLFGEWIVPMTEELLSRVLPFQFVQEAFMGKFGLVSVGLSLAFGVVLPVLLTFFFAFGVLEDSGYLPRLSILLDRVFRKIGLTGKGVLPLVMGFSCITMAILTTRTLETRRERFLATLLLVLGIPCAPVMAVILVLVGGMSIWAAVTVFGIIIIQIILIGFIASKVLPGQRSDFILELPPIRIPKFQALVKKTTWRIWWFAKEALPLFLLATFILFLLEKVGMLSFLEKAGTPVLTGFLGLPPESIQVAIMTLIRKESGAALLTQFSDSGQFDNVQIVVCLLLLTFLSPCVNAIIVMVKERGVKGALSIMAFVASYALVVGATVNWICRAFNVRF